MCRTICIYVLLYMFPAIFICVPNYVYVCFLLCVFVLLNMNVCALLCVCPTMFMCATYYVYVCSILCPCVLLCAFVFFMYKRFFFYVYVYACKFLLCMCAYYVHLTICTYVSHNLNVYFLQRVYVFFTMLCVFLTLDMSK